jgi:ribosomal protein S18 acetylase RimI-like enzyme
MASEKITYEIKVEPSSRQNFSSPEVSVYTKKIMTKELRALALQCGIFSRFATDTHFKRNEYAKLYQTWMKKSVIGLLSFAVVVYCDDKKKIRGVITLEKKDGVAHIGLFVVDKDFRGQSVGKRLMQEALRIFWTHDLRRVLVTTQGKNIAARTFYEKVGFRQKAKESTYHFWL